MSMLDITLKKYKIGDICTLKSGGTPSRAQSEYYGGEIPWAKIGDLESSSDGFVYETSEMITKEGLKSINNKIFEKGTLLLAIYGSVGKVAFAGTKLSTNQAILGIQAKSQDVLDLKYLKHWLVSIKEKLIHGARGVALKNLSATIVKNLKIPLPPLAEQKKIAAILDAADSLRQKDQQLIDHYTTLSQSLFLEMFGDPVANSMGWEVKRLFEVSMSQLGKMLSKKAKQNINPKKYLRNANVRWRSFDLGNVLKMDFNNREISKFNLLNGDLLVCEGGEVGRCAIWREALTDCYFQKALHRIRVNKDILTPEYLQEYFFWMARLGGLMSSVSEVTFSHLTAEKLKQLKVPMPPISLQKQFASHISIIEQQKQQAQASLEKSEALFNSLLQRAFKGELTARKAA